MGSTSLLFTIIIWEIFLGTLSRRVKGKSRNNQYVGSTESGPKDDLFSLGRRFCAHQKVTFAEALKEIKDGEEKDPDQVDQVPEEAADFDAVGLTGPGMYAPLRWGEAVPLWFLQQKLRWTRPLDWPACSLNRRAQDW